MHGWLYLKPRTALPPAFDIVYGSMIAAGIEYDRYREIIRVSPLIGNQRWLVLSPLVNTTIVTRESTSVPVMPVSPGSVSIVYGGFGANINNTLTNRTNRNEPIAQTTTPFNIGASPRPMPNELLLLKL